MLIYRLSHRQMLELSKQAMDAELVDNLWTLSEIFLKEKLQGCSN